MHPHPSYGGDRFNNVVTALYRALPEIGVSATRFDFSSDRIDDCAAETLELLALTEPAPRFLVAYSFGGGVAATVTDERVAGWILIAPALSFVDEAVGADERPKLVLAAAHDQFFPRDAVDEATSAWAATDHAVIDGADHFFVGRTDAVVAAALPWLENIRPGGR
jgi:alpha/beta superfamily hydrolase